MQPTPLRAVGYRRVSSQEQTEGYSLEAQEVHIQTYAETQGWQLIRIYTDAGISAKKGSSRPAFEEMLKDARDDQFDVVVVDKIDRFYRHLGGLLSTLDQLNNHNVALASVQEKLDFTSPWGKLMLTVLGMLAEIYIDNLRQETKKGQQQRARKGLWVGGVPFGYCNGLCSNCERPNGKGYCPNYGGPNQSDGKLLIFHPIESIAVKLVFEWYLTGQHSTASIAKALSQHVITLPDGTQVQLRQKGQKGYSQPGAFSKDIIRGILGREFYTGKLPYVGMDENDKYRSRKPPIDVYKGIHPPLISEDAFAKAAELRQLLGKTMMVKNNRPSRSYPLTGILKCGYCGANLRGVSNKRRPYYRDASVTEALLDCEQPRLRAIPLETSIADILKVVLQSGDTHPIHALQAEFLAGEERFKRARELYLSGLLEREEFERESTQFEAYKEVLQENNLRATMTLLDCAKTDLERWSELLPTEQKRLLRLVLEGVWVRRNAIVAVQPTIAFLPLFGEPKSGNCGEGGIRTRDPFRDSRSPGVRTRPYYATSPVSG